MFLIWYINKFDLVQQPNGSLLKRNEGTGQLSYSKRPERPENTTKVDHRFISVVMKINLCITVKICNQETLIQKLYNKTQITGYTKDHNGQIRLC